MTMLFAQLTSDNIRQLKPKQILCEQGLQFERLANGDGQWRIETVKDNVKSWELLGKTSEGFTLSDAKLQLILSKINIDSDKNTLATPQKGHLRQNNPQSVPFEQAAKEYIERQQTIEGKNLPAKTRQLKLFLVPFFKQQPLSKIKSFDVEQYKKYRRQMGVKPATVNRDLATLSHLMNSAIEWEWLNHRPCRIRKFKEDNTRIQYLTKAQIKQLLHAAKADRDSRVYLFILIALETSMRRSEILAIKISNIHLQQRIISIPKAKAGAREQPITANLANTLAPIVKESHASPWLFPSHISQSGHIVAIETAFKRVLKRAGLEGLSITIHTLRHTAITHLVQSGIDLPTVQRISGHKTLEMVLRYSHQNGKHVFDAMDKLQQRYQDVPEDSTTQK